MNTVIRSRRVVLARGERPATVRIEEGRIVAVEPYHAGGPGLDLGELALLPGLVDTHVHVNEPGRTHWEGFDSATRAAAAGGVTTIIDMPLNSIPPTVDPAALAVKRAAASGQSHVDVGCWGGAVPSNLDTLPELYAAGVFGFKCFLAPSGVDEFGHLDPAGLHRAMAAVPDAVFCVHAEDPDGLRTPAVSRRYADFLASRPPDAERRAIATVIEAARRTGAPAHIAHLSASGAAGALRAARRDGVRVTAETCPHYLALSAGEVPDGDTGFKCCPPIRDTANRDALWGALGAGDIDCVVSDHSPCPPDLKRPDTGDFGSAWGGIASVQLGLPVVWTGARRRGFTLGDVVRWMSRAPADLVGLVHKGRIEPGADADLVAFAPDERFVVDPARLHHRHPVTPYAGRELTGVVHRTWLRGTEIDPAHPRGRTLTRDGGPLWT